VTVVVVGPVMLVAYLLLLRVFHVTELRDLMRPLMARFGRGAPAVPGAAAEPTTAARATVSDDTGLIPRISGEFDAASFRAGPALEPEPTVEAPAKTSHATDPSRPQEPHTNYLPDEDVPSSAKGGRFHPQVPLPGRRTYQGEPGQNPHFPATRDASQHTKRKRKQ
jgi:putative peptidoglycan lipid II flippase